MQLASIDNMPTTTLNGKPMKDLPKAERLSILDFYAGALFVSGFISQSERTKAHQKILTEIEQIKRCWQDYKYYMAKGNIKTRLYGYNKRHEVKDRFTVITDYIPQTTCYANSRLSTPKSLSL